MTSYKYGWYFSYQYHWKRETHSYTLVVNIRVTEHSGKGVVTPPRGMCNRNGFGRMRVKSSTVRFCYFNAAPVKYIGLHHVNNYKLWLSTKQDSFELAGLKKKKKSKNTLLNSHCTCFVLDASLEIKYYSRNSINVSPTIHIPLHMHTAHEIPSVAAPIKCKYQRTPPQGHIVGTCRQGCMR